MTAPTARLRKRHLAYHYTAERRRKVEAATYEWEHRPCEICGGEGFTLFLGQRVDCPAGCAR